MNGFRWMIAATLSASLLVVLAFAQDFPEPPPEEPKKKEGSLQPRPEDDPKTELWVAKLGAARATPLSTEPGVLLHHVISPDGERFYYYRQVAKSDGKDGKPASVTYALFTVGPSKAESKVADTGADSTPPLFLEDGRILFTTRRYDLNEDGAIDELDDATLMVGNRDGGNLRNVASLQPGDTPVAVWNQDREVLVASAGEEDANGWIISINLVRGDRTRVVRGFNVEMVLDDGRILIERQDPPENDKPKAPGWNRWGMVVPDEDLDEPLPSLLDPSVHIIFDPKDGSEAPLYGASHRSRIVVNAEGSFFGHQEPSEPDDSTQRWNYWGPETVARQVSEVLIVDDAQHHDSRSPSARYNYNSIGWIVDRGLLVIEQGNLGSKLLLFDHALKTHRLADFDLNARGFVASRNGLTIGWLDVEDTDKNGYLEPWKDNSRINYTRIE
ncbi:MAG: hypothetical protein KDB90_00560 [Planctomycetes bacterium]|nr:hypothetical protein [Planctomycetota bacterium]